jgi:predicted CXXCH cytochrome family protein
MMCAGCHVIEGHGGSGGPSLDDLGVRRTPAQLLDRMRQRRAGTLMPPLPPDTSDQQLNELVDYMATLKGNAGGAAKPTAAAGSPMVTGCETCHGPGKAHADAEQNAAGDAAKEAAGSKLIFSFHANPKENSERCMICHNTSKQQELFPHSQHQEAGVSCNECHTLHLVIETKNQNRRSLSSAQASFFQAPQLRDSVRWSQNSMLTQSEPDLCFKCHGNIQALFALPVHHRVPEQLIKCTDCHNPHGSINRASLNNPRWETCVKCHVEKRGPYLYEHPAVRVEGCVICHNPHGSTNRMLLVRREGRQLCLQCHTGFHAQSGVPHGRLGFQTSGECVRCHVSIHGSNFDPNFLR